MTNQSIKYFLGVVLVVAVAATSCTKSFLEKEPIGRTGRETLFKDMDGIRGALVGAYNRMAYYYTREFTMYGDVAGDDVALRLSGASGDAQLLLYNEHNFQSNSDDDELAVGHIWLNIFEALNNVNNIIHAAPALAEANAQNKAELDRIVGQALVMRALCHFDLSKVYAQHYRFTPDASHLGVPVLLKTPSPGEPITRKTMQQTYGQVIADLKEGIRLMELQPADKDPFAASPQAAKALLSRVYLYMEDWDAAIGYAGEVISDGAFPLTPAEQYKEMFITGTPGSEMIWKLYSRKVGASTLASYYSSESFQAYAAGQLLALYGDEDVRKTVFNTSLGMTYSLKYGKKDGIPDTDWPIDPKVVRTSEVYLNRAEALWHKGRYGEAAEDLRVIAQRAHPTTTVEITYSAPADLLAQIEAERRRELCFEGHRLYDITRRKQSLQRGADCTALKCSLSYPNARFVLPIPSKELDANSAMQPNPEIN